MTADNVLRLHELNIQTGKTIFASNVNDELNQLVASVNSKASRVIDENILSSWSFNKGVVLGGSSPSNAAGSFWYDAVSGNFKGQAGGNIYTFQPEVAIANSGPTAPTTTVAGMQWFDTANNIFKQRNVTNTAWIDRWDMTDTQLADIANDVQAFGIGATAITLLTDLNSPLNDKGGASRVNSSTANLPSTWGSDDGVALTFFTADANNGTQLLTSKVDARTFVRSKNGGTWTAWQQMGVSLDRDVIQGSAPVWASNTTITMGTLNCLDSLRTSLITCSSVTLNFSTTGLNGLDTGTIASNTWYYIYAILNPTTLATGYLASTSATSPTLPSGFTRFRLLTAVTTLAGSAVLDNVDWFNWGNQHTVRYNNTTTDKQVLTGGTATAFTTISASTTAPIGTTQLQLAIYGGTSNGERATWLRKTGSGVSDGRRVHMFFDDYSSFTNIYLTSAEIGLNSSRQFDYRVSGAGLAVSIWATGYIMEV